jgi:hypothetical protein
MQQRPRSSSVDPVPGKKRSAASSTRLRLQAGGRASPVLFHMGRHAGAKCRATRTIPHGLFEEVRRRRRRVTAPRFQRQEDARPLACRSCAATRCREPPGTESAQSRARQLSHRDLLDAGRNDRRQSPPASPCHDPRHFPTASSSATPGRRANARVIGRASPADRARRAAVHRNSRSSSPPRFDADGRPWVWLAGEPGFAEALTRKLRVDGTLALAPDEMRTPRGGQAHRCCSSTSPRAVVCA